MISSIEANLNALRESLGPAAEVITHDLGDDLGSGAKALFEGVQVGREDVYKRQGQARFVLWLSGRGGSAVHNRRRGGCWSRGRAVSYTHLDVYKRQTRARASAS